VKQRRVAKVAKAKLPVVRNERWEGLDQVHEVGVRRLQVLDDGAQARALGRREDASDDDVERVLREAVRGAEHPVDSEQ